MSPAILIALGSAILFGLSTPVAKLLLGETNPWMLAGLLYGGAGVGLLVVYVAGHARNDGEARLARADLPWLAGAVSSGGIIGPVLLLFGLARVEASAASLLLTLEGVFTALLAWFVFKENFDRRIAVGMMSIVAGVVVLNWRPDGTISDLVGPAALAAACLAWAIDNNLTRRVSLSNPVQIAMIKGLVAGPVNLGIGLLAGAALPPAGTVGVAALTGFSGGATVGRSVIIAGQVGTNQHITIGDRAVVTARTGVTKSVEAGKIVGGLPVQDHMKWRRLQALIAKLPELFERVKNLEKDKSIES
jgi:drug/metabolite transporter (DMT)-like permease